MATITKITGDTAYISLTLAQIIDRTKRLCGRDAGGFHTSDYREWIDGVMGELFGDTKQKWIEAESQIETQAEFNDGTATFTKGDTKVTFSEVIPADIVTTSKKICMDGDKTGYEIVTRTTNTELEMKFAFMRESATEVKFKIVLDTYDLQSDVESLKVVDQHFSNLNMLLVRNLPVQFKIGKRPQLVKLNQDKTVTLYPAPDRVLHLTYEYFRLFSLRTSDLTVVTQLPDMWVQYLTFGVARNFWLTQTTRIGIAKATQFSNLFDAGVMKVRMEKYKFDGELVQFVPYRQPGVSSLQTGIDQQVLAQDLLG